MRSSRTIGQAAQECGVRVHLLRQWEDAGLLTPARVHGQRRYTEPDVLQVKLIKFGRELGIGLAGLRELLAVRDTADRDAVLRRRKQQLEHHIALARRQLELIEHGLACPHPDYRSCPDAVALAGQPVLAD
ncbi:helix-turn-helix domain-containing protein [Cryptosporangium minutisporangium]